MTAATPRMRFKEAKNKKFNIGRGAEFDDRYVEAVELILQFRHASISYLQRSMKMGFDRAARIIDSMEVEGILSPSEGNRPRLILMSLEDWRKRNTTGRRGQAK